MTPFTYGFTKAVNDMCLRDIEREEVLEVVDHAQEAYESPAEQRGAIQSLGAWLRSLIHPAPAPRVRRRHA